MVTAPVIVAGLWAGASTAGAQWGLRQAAPQPRLAYTCFRHQRGERTSNICVANADGTDERILGTDTKHGFNIAPTWSPDGTQLAYLCNWRRESANTFFPMRDVVDLGVVGFARNAGGELCIVDADGGQPRVLTQSARHVNALAWAPDGTRIAYSLGTGPVTTPGDGAAASAVGIYVLGVDSTQPAQRLTTEEGDMPAWSPAGDQIAFVEAPGFLKVVDVATGTQRAIDGGEGVDLGPAWSPDGRLVAFTRLTPGGQRETFVVGPSGSPRARRIATTQQLDPNMGISFTPAWIPNGTGVIVLQVTTPGAKSAQAHLVLANTSPGVPALVSPELAVAKAWGAYSPAVSPDGRFVAYVDDRVHGKTGIHRLHVTTFNHFDDHQVRIRGLPDDPKWVAELEPAWQPMPRPIAVGVLAAPREGG